LATKIGTTKISNSYRGMRFEVRKRDIEQGQPNDPCSCAAALALRREADAKEVFVYRDVTYVVKKDGSALRFKTTPALRLETVVFDRKGQFYPGEYDLGPGPLPTKKAKASRSSSAPTKRNRPQVRHTIPNVRPTASQRLARV